MTTQKIVRSEGAAVTDPWSYYLGGEPTLLVAECQITPDWRWWDGDKNLAPSPGRCLLEKWIQYPSRGLRLSAGIALVIDSLEGDLIRGRGLQSDDLDTYPGHLLREALSAVQAGSADALALRWPKDQPH